jgi:hypothetical protein
MQIAEKHYLGLVRGIPREARTLEAAILVGHEWSQEIVNDNAYQSGARLAW